MDHDDRLSELLVIWEERRVKGSPVSPAELCRDCPELLPALDEQIRAICSMDELLGGTVCGQDTEIFAGSTNPAPTDRSSVEGRLMSTVSEYEILRSHARGGLGEVLVAHDERLGRNVALKVIRQPHDRDPERRRRFVREAEITSRLEHPGIVPVHGIGQDSEGRLCYSMRLISGESLHEAISKFHGSPELKDNDRDRNLEFRQLLTRFVSVCNTIAYAHSQGVLHRDLKPANIMFGAFGETLVVDWGLAKKIEKGETSETVQSAVETVGQSGLDTDLHAESREDLATRAGQTLGTPAFMSPEQSRGDAHLTPASDIYSLGATIYMLLTGRPPFAGRNLADIVAAVQRGDFPAPRQVKASIAKPLEAICLKAMSLRPTERYTSALELATDLERWLADEPISAYREPVTVRCSRWMRRHRLLVGSLSASLLVAIASLIVLLGFMSRANERLQTANELEKKAKGEAVTHAATATKNAELAEHQSELALRSLQSVTFDIQRQLKNVPAAHKVRRQLLNTALKGLAEVAAKLEQRPQVDRSLMTAHRDLGDVFFEVGSEAESGGSEAARVQYQRAFDIAETLATAEATNQEAQRQLAICHVRLGDVNDRIGSTATARDHYQSSLTICERLLAVTPNDEQILRDVSVSLNRLGDLSLKGGAVEAAKDYFNRALDIRKDQAARKVVDTDLERDLVLSYNKMGNVTLRIGDAKQAAELISEGLKISRKRARENPQDDEAQRDLTTSYERLGDSLKKLGNFQASADYYQQSLDITSRRMAADPTNAQIQRDLMQASDKMADALITLGKPEEAQTHLKKTVTLCEQLVAADPEDRRAMRDLAIAYIAQADRLTAASQYDEAIQYYRKSLTIRQKRAAADPSDARGPSDVAFGLTKLGEGLLAKKEVDEALLNFSEALRIHQQRCDANPTDRLAQSNLAAYHQRIGIACRRAGKFDQSAEQYQEALKIAKKLSADDPNDIPVRIMMLTFYHSLGFLEESRKRFTEAYQWYGQGLELAKQLSAAGKLVGEDATWVSYIEDAIRECKNAEKANDKKEGSDVQNSKLVE
jgi:serine/threonine protein kinase/tetratricopeptide (TPR) repeat protein